MILGFVFIFFPPEGLFPPNSNISVASVSRRGWLFMSADYWVDKMDHVVSSLISVFVYFSPSLLLEPLRPEARGSLETCHVTFGCQRSVKRVKRGPPVHISWKCRKPAQHTTSSGSTSSAGLPVMSAGSRTDRSRKRRRRSARLPAGQSSRTPRLLWAKRSSPGWKSPDSQSRNPAGEAQVCATQRAGGLFHFCSF